MAALILLAVIWGYNWVVMKKSLIYMGPFDFNAVRMLLGGILLLSIMGCRGMLKRFKQQAMIFEPLTGPDMKRGYFFRYQVLPQSLAQQIPEEMVIAIPLPLIVERHTEQIGALKIFQRRLPGTDRREQQRFAQRPA